MVVHLVSPDQRYDVVYLRNYALLQVKGRAGSIPGMGQVLIFGGGDYARRIWLDPQSACSGRGLSAGDVVRAIREQNVQVAAGIVGGPPMPEQVAYQLTVNARGRLVDEQEFGDIIIKAGGGASSPGCVTWPGSARGRSYASGRCSITPTRSRFRCSRRPDRTRSSSRTMAAAMAELKQNFPAGWTT